MIYWKQTIFKTYNKPSQPSHSRSKDDQQVVFLIIRHIIIINDKKI